MNTYTWELRDVRVQPEQDGFQNIVRFVAYAVHAASDSGHTAKILGSTVFEEFYPDRFTPIETVTNETVIGWLKATLNIENIYALLDEKILIEQSKNQYVEVNLGG